MKKSSWNKGLKWSDEVKNKFRIAKLGKTTSEETKKKMSDKHKELGTGKWMIGKKHTKETSLG